MSGNGAGTTHPIRIESFKYSRSRPDLKSRARDGREVSGCDPRRPTDTGRDAGLKGDRELERRIRRARVALKQPFVVGSTATQSCATE
jgi:hypothetical protein